MQSFNREEVSVWFLSGQPVVRIWGRDYDMPTDRYYQWLLEVARAFNVDVQLQRLSDPSGIVVRAYAGEEPPPLMDPLLAVTKKTFPFLYCTAKGCSIRLLEGITGAPCKKHESGV